MLMEADTGLVIWASVATGELKNLDPETAKKRLEYAVSSMFNELPQY